MEEIDKVLNERRNSIIEGFEGIDIEEEASTHSMPTEKDFLNTATQKDR